MFTLSSRRAVLLGIPAILAATAVTAGLFARGVPDDLNLALERPTDAGRYVAAIAPVDTPIIVGPMHAWTVRLTEADGSPIETASIAIDGGMPQHGHGLHTAPAVTEALGDGRFLIEGMKFNMPGWWEIDLAIDGPAGADSVTFNLVL